VTVPDGTAWAPGQAFNKIWRLRNIGNCAWGPGYQFVFIGGDAMTTINTLAVPVTAPSATGDLLIAMTAPTTPGAHSGQWQMRNASGVLFGPAIGVSINVTAPPASSSAPPAPAGCSGSSIIASFTATATTISAGSSTTLNWGAVTNADSVEIDHGIGGVPAPGSRSVSPGTTTTYTLTAHCGANTTTAQITITVVPPLPPAIFVGNFSGHWVMNFGAMDITQSGANVTGTYHNSFTGGNGTIAGTVTANTLNGTYTIGGSGPFQLTLGGGGNTFDGNWNSSNKWCGARSGTAFPSGCGYSGSWSTTLTGYPSCSMTLTQTDTSVSGTYCNGTITGVTSFTSDAAVLSGLWHIGSGTGSIEFYLLGYNGLQFQGSFGGTTQWCGWRGGAPAPTPCKR
jgi:hypothetical protein